MSDSVTMRYANPFVPGVTGEWDVDPYTLRIDRITYASLIEWAQRDGRLMGLLADRMLCARYDNLVLPVKECGSFDVLEHPVNGGARAWEVKTAARGRGANLVPSLMKGKGRTFDSARHGLRREGLYGYIILDVSRLPRFRMIGLPMSVIVRNGYIKQIPRRHLDRIFSQDLFSAIA